MEWPLVPIGRLCRLVNGRAFKPSDWTVDGLPIVRIQNLNDHAKPFNRYNGRVDQRVLIDSGDILLSWSGTPGTSFGCFLWERGPAILNQHIFRVHTDTTQVDSEFFIHAVNSRLEEMIGLAHGGVGLRHITKGKLEGIKVAGSATGGSAMSRNQDSRLHGANRRGCRAPCAIAGYGNRAVARVL